MEVKTTYDAIVVGSGISGGWAAKGLCKKGLKTLLLNKWNQCTISIIYSSLTALAMDYAVKKLKKGNI